MRGKDYTIETLEAIILERSNLPGLGIRACLKAGWIYYHGGAYHLTEAGRDYYRAVRDDPTLTVDASRFKTEVLTGLRECKSPSSNYIISAPTEIENGALPHSTSFCTEPDDYEYRHQAVDLERALAQQLGIDTDKLSTYLEDGRIKICKGLDNHQHIGIFDKKGKGRLQALCRDCNRIKKSI